MIFITVINKKWYPGRDYLKEYPAKVQHDFDKYIAKEYVFEVQKCIDNQSLPWRRLTPRYLEKKRKLGLSTKTWEATKTLRNNLKVFERKSYYEVGWEKGLKPKSVRGFNNSNSQTVLQIARRLEYGDLVIPPRPLFRPICSKMEKDMSIYVKEYLRKNNPDKKLSYRVLDKFKRFGKNDKSDFVSRSKSYAKKGRDLINEFFGL